MAAPATPATPSASSAPTNPNAIIERIREWAAAHPEATEYAVHDEDEACQLLLVVANQVAMQLPQIRDRNRRSEYRRVVMGYRRAVYEGRALELLREMTAEDQLELYGLRIVVPAIFVQ